MRQPFHRLREFKPTRNSIKFYRDKIADRLGRYGVPKGMVCHRVIGWCYIQFLQKYLPITVTINPMAMHSAFAVNIGIGSVEYTDIDPANSWMDSGRGDAGIVFDISCRVTRLGSDILKSTRSDEDTLFPPSHFVFNETGLNTKILGDMLADSHFELIDIAKTEKFGLRKEFKLYEDEFIKPRYYFASLSSR